MEGLGFHCFWGHTPAINVFKGSDNVDLNNDEKEINILLSQNGGDAKNLLKSISDAIVECDDQSTKPLNFYIHETKKENLARILLFLTLFCETGLSIRERMEIFLDIYGNCMIRDRSSQYLDEIVPELIQLVTDDDRCVSPIKDLINFETLKFKERDEIEEIVSLWLSSHPFDIEKYRDTRLRQHFGKRYDVRRNQCDWDFNFGIKDFAPHVNQQEYRQFRMNGVAFETRLATGSISNRTLASTVEGRNRTKDRLQCNVRGFWGDIVNSPYLSFGMEVDDKDDKFRFYKHVNFQAVYTNSDISEYNLQKIIYQMEELDEFEFKFERLRHILGKKFDNPTGEKPREKKKNKRKEQERMRLEKEKAANKSDIASTNDTDATGIEEITDEQAEQIEKEEAEAKKKAEEEAAKQVLEEEEAAKKRAQKLKDIENKKINSADDMNDALKDAQKPIDLGKIDEGHGNIKKENEGTRQLLDGYTHLNVKIHFLSEPLDKLYTKQKYQDLFDIGVLSTVSGIRIKDELVNNIFKKGAKVHVETGDNLIPLKKDNKALFRSKIQEYAEGAGWRLCNEEFKHHKLYEVTKIPAIKKEEAKEERNMLEIMADNQVKDEDDEEDKTEEVQEAAKKVVQEKADDNQILS